MKFVRLGALFGSIVLIVATTVTMIDKRAELRGRQDDRATAAALVSTQSVATTIERAEALAEVAADASSADAVDPTVLVSSFADAAACVLDGSTERCSGATLVATGTFDEAERIAAASGAPAAVADTATDSVMVVAVGEVTVAISVPADALVGDAANLALGSLEANTTVVVTKGSGPVAGPVGPTTVEGSRVVTTSVPLDEQRGSVLVISGVVDDVGLFGENLGLYGSLLGLGTVLIALAGWTFLAERKSLERRATTDELTGLVNRREFERLTEEELLDSGRFGTGVCMMLVDLNGFKQINDTLGHQFGDLVLQACAERLTSSVRETDIVGRWGGDEFVVLLPGIEDGSAVRTSAERIAAKLSSTPVVGDVSISGSIGAALYPRHGDNLEELVRAADLAMYEAKTTGVNHRLADPFTLEAARDSLAESYHGPDRRRHPSMGNVSNGNVDRFV